ncbi:MAG: SDR family NAD(P)-dependent oxidoreductase, partial [Gammaproteobacteria bacterium]|nr:SDR family NAD(P)-dependent oxidoreductase [Gammaproteobacteria bacterium]
MEDSAPWRAALMPLFHLSKALLARKNRNTIPIMLLHHSSEGSLEANLSSGIAAFGKTLSLENPLLGFRLIHAATEIDHGNLAALVEREIRHPEIDQREIRYPNATERLARTHRAFIPQPPVPAEALEQGKVYLITGGLGGLGLMFAEYLARTRGAKLALTGRSPVGEKQQAQIDRLEALGAEVLYIPTDITDRTAVEKLIEQITQHFGELNAVLHSAGVLRDAFALKKSSEHFEEVLAPKITGTLLLDQATAEQPLELFLLFSSIAGAFGNPGQCDYACANAFMDAFAESRQQLVEKGERRGRALSINWPLWSSGGMHITPQIEKFLLLNFGMKSLETEAGLHALEQGLASPQSNFGVVQGIPDKLIERLKIEPLSGEQSATAAQYQANTIEADASAEKIRPRLIEHLRDLMADETKLNKTEIIPSLPLERYGIDSVMILSLTQDLEQEIGQLPKTLFFDVTTLNELADYLLKHKAAEVTVRFGGGRAGDSSEGRTLTSPPSTTPAAVKAQRRSRFTHTAGSHQGGGMQDIAIIGVSGRYPMAEDINAFWENLSQGRDCVTEIPVERWDYRHHFLPKEQIRNDPTKSYSKWGGFLDGVDLFDPLFFNISPKDAELLDPQERLFLETAYHTLEDAGYTPANLEAERDVGVFVGVMWGQYQLYGAANPKAMPGSAYWSIANRVSYTFDFHGPCMAVDTACSSSLSAIHLACESIRRGECRVAIAGGVNIS